MKSALRILLSLTAIFVMAGIGFGQVPNSGFESWSAGNPVSWYTNNGLYTFVTQATPGHGGSAAAQGSIVNMNTFNTSPQLTTAGSDGRGFAVTQRYAAVHGYYKFTSVGGDVFYVNYLAQKGTSGVCSGAFLETQPQVTFKEFVADIMYPPGSDMPDNGIINFFISGVGGPPHIGSTFIVDDLSFGPSTGIYDNPDGSPTAFRLERNYPNPFNPTTNIVFDVPAQSHVKLVVLDLLGREVSVLVDQMQSAGRYKAVFDASRLTSGVYFYRLTSGNFSQTARMLVLR